MNKVKNIARNTSYLTLALIIQKIISFAYFTLIARYLGMDILGQYYTAVAFTTILALVLDLGFANILIREIAKNQDKANSWLQPVLALKILLAILAAALAYVFAKLAGYNLLIINLIAISFLAMLFDSLANTFFSVIRGFHNLKYESIAAIVFQLIIFVFGIMVMKLDLGPLYLMLIMTSASFFNLSLATLVAKFKFNLNILPKFNWFLTKKILILSWPFAVYNILQRIYSYLDSLLLGFLANYIQVGLYQIAFKIVFALQFLPLAFIASLYPAMSAYWQNNRQQLDISFKRAINYLIIISIPIIFGVIAISSDVVLLMGAEKEAVWPLRVIMLSLFFIFLNFPVGSLLNACDRQKRNTFNMTIVTISSIALNLVFIPLWQAVGASLTVLLTNILLLSLGLRASRSLIKYRIKDSFKILSKVILASLIMVSIAFLIKEVIHLYLAVIIAGLVYFIILYYINGFNREDIKSIIQSFIKKKIYEN